MGKLGDLWVRLGLKSDDYEKGLDKAKKETGEFTKETEKNGKNMAGIWAAIAAAVVGFAKSFVNSSQIMSDKWNVMTEKMKSSWSSFMTALTNQDWAGFQRKIGSVMDAVAESVAAHDAEFEVRNAIKLRKSVMADELAQLQILMRDTRKSYDERAKAAQDYLDKVAPLYQMEIDLRKRIYMTDTGEYLEKAGLGVTADNRDLLRTFFTDILPNEKLVNQLFNYTKKNKGTKKLGKKDYNLSREDLADIDAFFGQYGMREGSVLATLAHYYQGSNDEAANKVVTAIQSYDASLAAFNEETRRIQTVQNTAEAQMGATADNTAVWSEANLNNIKSAHEIAVKLGQQMDKDLTKLNEEFSEIGDIDIDLSDIDNEINAFLDSWKAGVDQVASLNYMLEDSIVSSMQNGIQALTDAIFQLEGADWKSVLAAFIAPLGDTMKQMGAMIMAEGVAMSAFKKSFTNPATAIAAGAALIAVGSLVSSGLQKLISGTGNGGGSAMSYGSSSSGGAAALNYESTLTVEVTGRISGNDIVLSGKKTNDKNSR